MIICSLSLWRTLLFKKEAWNLIWSQIFWNIILPAIANPMMDRPISRLAASIKSWAVLIELLSLWVNGKLINTSKYWCKLKLSIYLSNYEMKSMFSNYNMLDKVCVINLITEVKLDSYLDRRQCHNSKSGLFFYSFCDHWHTENHT